MNADVHVLSGMSEIVNHSNVRSDLDLRELESQILGGDKTESVPTDDRFELEMQEVARNLGVDFKGGELIESPAPSAATSPRVPPRISVDFVPSPVENAFMATDSPRTSPAAREQLPPERAMGRMGGLHIDEDRISMLEEIDTLRSALQEDNVDVSRLAAVDSRTDLDTIRETLGMLRSKHCRSRYCNLAEECLLVGAHLLEEIFDGRQTYFGRQIDMRGWSNTVNVKLRRLRPDTSELVAQTMNSLNIGPGTRLLLELIPSAIMYSKLRKTQSHADTLYNDADIAAASARLRKYE